MTDDRQRQVTTLLEAIRAGSPGARDELFALVYDELRQLGSGLLRRERPGHTPQPTALVHEAILRLLGPEALAAAQSRAQFLAAATMRQVLVDHSRQRAADKRGERLPLDEVLDYFAEQRLDLLEVHETLTRLARLHERQCQVVELRFFGGYTALEAAEPLGVSLSTVESDFRKATAFLRGQLSEKA